MKTFFALLLTTLCAATTYGQTMKALSYNASNGVVAYSSTNALTFTNGFNAPSLNYNNKVVFSAEEDSIFSQNSGAGESVANWQSDFWTFRVPVTFDTTNIAAQTRSNLGLPLAALTNGNVTNFRTAIGLGATNNVSIGEDGGSLTTDDLNAGNVNVSSAVTFTTNTAAPTTRTNLGLGATWLTNDNVTNFRTAIGLGATNNVQFNQVDAQTFFVDENGAITFNSINEAAATRTNLGLGATNIVTFAGLTNNGDININCTTASNGLLFIRRTNNEAFLGLANLLASNNTTISNETLFRVGTAEATNRSAQFGFRSTNTNGSGVAVFSVFGYNALMQIGVDASTNAVIYSGGGTNNEVMTLIRDGATEFARPIRFSTNASTRPATNAPANTTNAAAWVEMRVGTNSYRVPLYQ
jgi:hypothetical protein